MTRLDAVRTSTDYASDVATSPLTLLRALLQRPGSVPDDAKARVRVLYAKADDRIKSPHQPAGQTWRPA